MKITPSEYTQTTDGSRQSLSATPKLLTDGVKPSSQYRATGATAQPTRIMRQQLQPTKTAETPAKIRWAAGLKAVVNELQRLNLLTLGRLADGRRVIILPSTVWNDDLTLRGENE